MVKDPRPDKPGSSEPDETLDLLRALARARGNPSPQPEAESPPSGQPDDKLDALRALTKKLEFQLRSGSTAAPAPDPAEKIAAPADDDAPPRRAWADRLRQTARREWRALVAALPEAGSLVPHFDR